MVRVEYIDYCGYVVETETAVYVFDFARGNLPSRYLKSPKPVLFFISHHHDGHYSTSVFNYKKTVILSSDIPITPYRDVFVVDPKDSINLGFAQVEVFDSTDAGVAYVVKEDNITIMHGGDLNNWHWKDVSSANEAKAETAAFMRIVEDLKKVGPIDIMMFVVDPRMGQDYDAGARAILNELNPKIFLPMHYKNDVKSITSFIDWATKNTNTRIEVPRHENKYYQFEI